jgi:mannose-6-phosphate isomerase-like protein (cupin superfamily)
MYFCDNIEKLTLANQNYRKVLFTGQHTQLVIMSLKPREEIGSEVHHDHDQFIRIEKGIAVAQIGSSVHQLSDGDAIIVPAGTIHNIINPSQKNPLKLYTLYAPPEHPHGITQKLKP